VPSAVQHHEIAGMENHTRNSLRVTSGLYCSEKRSSIANLRLANFWTIEAPPTSGERMADVRIEAAHSRRLTKTVMPITIMTAPTKTPVARRVD
jgi:hypothetical protein